MLIITIVIPNATVAARTKAIAIIYEVQKAEIAIQLFRKRS